MAQGRKAYTPEQKQALNFRDTLEIQAYEAMLANRSKLSPEQIGCYKVMKLEAETRIANRMAKPENHGDRFSIFGAALKAAKAS